MFFAKTPDDLDCEEMHSMKNSALSFQIYLGYLNEEQPFRSAMLLVPNSYDFAVYEIEE